MLTDTQRQDVRDAIQAMLRSAVTGATITLLTEDVAIVYSAVERIVEQAVAAAEAAENEACQMAIEKRRVVPHAEGYEWNDGNEATIDDVKADIRSRMTPARAAALEKVREEARADGRKEMNKVVDDAESALAEAEAEAKRLRDLLHWTVARLQSKLDVRACDCSGPEHDGDCKFAEAQLAALNALSAPAGAAQEASDGTA